MLYKFLLLIKTQTDQQTDRQADERTDKPMDRLYFFLWGFRMHCGWSQRFLNALTLKKRKEDDSVICNKTFYLFETYNAKLVSRTHRFVLSLCKSLRVFKSSWSYTFTVLIILERKKVPFPYIFIYGYRHHFFLNEKEQLHCACFAKILIPVGHIQL